jgi:predicted dehydrogenase
MTAAPLRWGVLGTARIALKKVIPAMQQTAAARVVAIASRDQVRARRAADDHGIERAYGTYEELLADPAVEAVYIPLPNHLHVPWAVRAADAGRHVLCEKPIGLDAAEARELLAARDRSGVVIAEAFMIRAHPQWHAVVDLVRAGRIGDLRLVDCHFSYFLDDTANIRNRPEWGGGGLMDIGCYAVHVARWLFDSEPERVACLMERDPVSGIDTLTSGILDFGGARATFTCGTRSVPGQRVQVMGTTGRIEVDVPFNAPADRPCTLRVDDGSDLFGGGIETLVIPPADQFALQADAFARVVSGRSAPLVSVEDAVANMMVLDALRRSAAEGTWAGVSPSAG